VVAVRLLGEGDFRMKFPPSRREGRVFRAARTPEPGGAEVSRLARPRLIPPLDPRLWPGHPYRRLFRCIGAGPLSASWSGLTSGCREPRYGEILVRP
jgi:hypothetical protein